MNLNPLSIYIVEINEKREIKANHRIVNVRHNKPLYKACSNFSNFGSSYIQGIEVEKAKIKVGHKYYSFDGNLITKEDLGQTDLVSKDNTSLTDYPFVSGNISCSVDKSNKCFK